MKCTACGGEGMVEGVLFDKADVSEIGFKASDWSVWSRMFGIGIMPVTAFGCARCAFATRGKIERGDARRDAFVLIDRDGRRSHHVIPEPARIRMTTVPPTVVITSSARNLD